MGDQRTSEDVLIKQDNNGQLEKEEACFQFLFSFAFCNRRCLLRSARIQKMNGMEEQNKSKFVCKDVTLQG